MIIPDQQRMWDKKHGNDEHAGFRNQPSELAELSLEYFPTHSRILEIGCGNGRDSLYFAKKGHTVLATDFSDVVLEQNRQFMNHDNVNYQNLDITKKFPFDNDLFNVVFANLSLHYFSDEDTANIFEEIKRVLKTKGILSFACKADDSQRKQNATYIGEDYVLGETGHVMHFFSTDYARKLIRGMNIIHLDQIDEFYVDRTSKITRCIVRK